MSIAARAPAPTPPTIRSQGVSKAAITAWTAVFTIAIGCTIVMLMKGPAYVADRYPLSDADEPRRDPQPRDDA